MSVIYFLLPLAILFSAAGLLAFLWSVQSGQFDDLDGEALRPVLEKDGE